MTQKVSLTVDITPESHFFLRDLPPETAVSVKGEASDSAMATIYGRGGDTVGTISLLEVPYDCPPIIVPERGGHLEILPTCGKPVRVVVDIFLTPPTERTLNATSPESAKAAIGDLEVWGDPDMLKLIAKASSKQQGFMKTMKAVEVTGLGAIVQFETREQPYAPNGSHYPAILSQSSVFIPGAVIREEKDEEGTVVRRYVESRENFVARAIQVAKAAKEEA